MIAYIYKERGKFELTDKPKPEIIDSRDAIVRVTLSSICSSDLHIKHGSVPRVMPGIIVGHEMVGVDDCDCDETLSLIEQGKIDTTPLITHCFALKDIEKAYEIFENKLYGVIKIALEN